MRSHERNHRDHYAEITDQILADLEAGTPPWRQPWDNAKADGPCMPQNAATGVRYRGINVSIRGRPSCRREWAFDLRVACMSAAKIKGRPQDGDHHRS
jgi:antirestriction protein ArdC